MEYKETKNFLKVEKLICKEFYEFFKEERRFNIKAVDQYNYFAKAISGILSKIRYYSEHNQSGVYIEGIGYFCFVKLKEKRRNNLSKTPLEKLRRRIVYTPFFIPDEKMNKWSFQPKSQKANRDDYRIDIDGIKFLLEFYKNNKE